MIGGNTIALFQVKDEGAKNAIGERIHQWADVASATGWLDLVNGDSKYTPHSAKIQESSHVFLCDFQSFKGLSSGWVWNPFSFAKGQVSSVKLDGAANCSTYTATVAVTSSWYNSGGGSTYQWGGCSHSNDYHCTIECTSGNY